MRHLGAGVVPVDQCQLKRRMNVVTKDCVTSYQIFSQCCVNRNVLELAIKYRTDSRAEQFDFSTNELRKAAYRQFVVWKY